LPHLPLPAAVNKDGSTQRSGPPKVPSLFAAASAKAAPAATPAGTPQLQAASGAAADARRKLAGTQ
jgi:hypothetical protein